MTELSQVRGQTNNSSARPQGIKKKEEERLGPPSGARPRRRARRRAPGCRVCHGARPGTARTSNVAPPHPTSSCGPTTCRKTCWGRGQGSRRTRPMRQKLTLGTWNVTSLWGKEPEHVREVGRYQLDLVRLTSMHSLCSGTVLLDGGWTRNLRYEPYRKYTGVICARVWIFDDAV